MQRVVKAGEMTTLVTVNQNGDPLVAILMAEVGAVHWIWLAMFGSGLVIGGLRTIMHIVQQIIPVDRRQETCVLHGVVHGMRKAGVSALLAAKH